MTSTCLATTTIRGTIPYRLRFVLAFISWNDIMSIQWLLRIGCLGFVATLCCWLYCGKIFWLPHDTFVTVQGLRILHLLYSSKWAEKEAASHDLLSFFSSMLALELWPENWSRISNKFIISRCFSERAKAVLFDCSSYCLNDHVWLKKYKK